MTGKLVRENLKNRPMRTLLSILLIAVAVALILTLVGLSHGMLEDSARRAEGIGADIIFRPPNTSLLTLSGAPLPEKLVDYLAHWPHVAVATGVVVQTVQTPLVVTGVDLSTFDRMSGGFTYLEGGPFQRPDDIIIDRYYAAQKRLHAGDRMPLFGRNWHVAGVIENGKLARIALPLNVLQNLLGETGKISQIYLKLDNPAMTAEVIRQLKAKFSDYPIYSMKEFTSLYSVDSVAGLKQFIYVIMGIGVVFGFLGVCLSMYMAVLQRTREIGILKALGAANGFVIRLILAEALALGVGGTVLGIGLSFLAWWLIQVLVPASIQMAIVPMWWPIAGAVALVSAALGAVYPGLRAARHDPIEALAYE
jgi:putative ABC transport system permease protein